MVDSDRRPSAQEIEELIDLVRRDPASPAFIDLAEAYLNLGRPKDAISVGKVGLDAAPDSLEGRVVLARAYAAMHQWKEAQGELLRVVKVDRSNRLGFALLGEVLLRRNDYERAVPVLQHAQNLDPTSPQILSMLKRARMNQPLDAPTPVPQPVPPRGETNYGLSLDESARQPVPAPPPSARSVPAAGPAMPTMAIQPAAADMRGDATEHQPQPYGAWNEPPRQKKLTAPPPMSVEGVRPRVVSAARPQNAAAASLRQSAAVGENYLNDLLTGGLLDVAGVRVPDADFDLRPDRRWGRSTRRAFIFLFVVLVVAIGGGGTYYYWTEKQKSEAITRLHKEAKDSIAGASFDDLEGCLKKLGEALEKDKANALTFTYIAECGGLESLLYGTDDNRVTQAIKAVQKDVKANDPGARELVIGKAAVTLATLARGDAPASALADVRKMLDDYLAKHDGDKWARWLKARAMLAAGERKEAIAVLKVAADGDDGIVPAMIDQADLLVDDGKLDEALAVYKRALEKSKDHPLAVLGKAMALAESTVDSNAAIDDLSVKLDKNIGPRVGAYRSLAFALAKQNIEDYIKAGEDLKNAESKPPAPEPRFWARVAWTHYIRGEYKQAADARGRIAWFGKNNAEDDPEVMLVDAALTLASGLPEKTLSIASKIEGVRPRLLRVQAQLDLKNAKGAMEDLNWILERAADNLEAQMLLEVAKMMLGTDKERAASADKLESLARKTKSKIGRHMLGMGYHLSGNDKDAQTQLQQAITEVTEDEPNPFLYRTRTALAEIALAAGDIKVAGDQLDEALKTNSGYLPTRIMQARVVLRNNDPDRALNLLTAVMSETQSPEVSLLQVEAICASKATTAKQKDQAKDVVGKLKEFNLPPEELSRVAAVCDPKLPEQLGLPAPGAAPAPDKPAKPAKPAKPNRRRGR
ncbi:MAG TPA: tetratricopeptide repeat protein [Kofleriaceae bacterium]|nr:tetratricopeptide repeat protein [Kofleriaceae bacterium]